MDSYKLFIDGEFVDAVSGEVVFETIDPGTGAPFCHGGESRQGGRGSGDCRGKKVF